jgi:predicted RNase H-like HicB family nuclease
MSIDYNDVMKTNNIIENRERIAYIHFMAKQEYTAVFQKKGRWFLAWIEEIPGINTQGRTMKEARQNLREALSLILKENKSISIRRNSTAHREKFVVAVGK